MKRTMKKINLDSASHLEKTTWLRGEERSVARE